MNNNIEDILRDMVREVNAYDGSLEEYLAWENNEEFFETFYGDRPMELARAIHFGDYDFMEAYVRIDGNGNLESLEDYIYENELINNADEIIATYTELASDNSIDSYLLEGILEEEENWDE